MKCTSPHIVHIISIQLNCELKRFTMNMEVLTITEQVHLVKDNISPNVVRRVLHGARVERRDTHGVTREKGVELCRAPKSSEFR